MIADSLLTGSSFGEQLNQEQLELKQLAGSKQIAGPNSER